MEETKSVVRLTQLSGYEFQVQVDQPEKCTITMDEPPPLGKGEGPAAGRMLAAAVGHCLSASLLFCLQKSRVSVQGITTEVQSIVRRGEGGRWRVAELQVQIDLKGLDPEQQSAFQRCASIFEDYCIVTASVRQGIPVKVSVTPSESGDAPRGG